ncbi:MAG: protein-disulfide reductase, partial [Flavipsychrobacter sp.]|nr:protein-disulfide reductase [Flavipsychrobacter sp.]
DKYELIAHLKLPVHWHIYSLKPGGDGMELPPAMTFDKNPMLILKGDLKERGKLLSETFPGIDGKVNMFKDHVDYIQTAVVKGNTKITGTYSYQICDDNMCLPPATKKFSIVITDAGGSTDTTTSALTAKTDSTTKENTTKNDGTVNADTATAKATITATLPLSDNKTTPASNNGVEQQSMLMLFLISFGGGILAIFTPCIFSMIPITISFFTKRSKTRAEGIKNAILYSLSIIVIFTVLGVLISAIFGSAALNTLSTDWRANLFFFIIITVFAISFLGAFEITLPSSWTSVTDSRAGVGSFLGIFFMALTLVIVSFSCTGPIVGPLLVLAGKGGIAGPTIGMLGFSIGLALPFALFAIFPGMINKLAQSGGWLNQIKVVLGFIELMLALKFLSNADLAMGWRLLDRELFIAIWIVLSVLLGFYLLGRLKLSHDDAPAKNIYGQEYVSLFKLFLAITSFTFAVYLLPGMWGAPLNGVSAFVPPIGTFDAFGGGGHASAANTETKSELAPVKYVNDMKIYEPPVVKNLGLVTYFDYDEALAASKKFKKPIMLDFTGINCVNCRKMESQVWSKPEVAKLLKEDFIVVSLYCDMNRIQLPKEQQYFSKDLNAQVVTLGNKNVDLQASKFGSNSQPYYFYVDEQGNKLADEGYSYDPDVQKFVDHLEKVKANFKKAHS